MPRKPTLSPTRLSTYLACPVKYRWTYVDDRGKWYLRAKSYYSFGTSLHRVLERFHDSGDAGVTTTAEAVAALEESWIESGYGSHEEMQEALGEGKGILERHVKVAVQRAPDVRTLYVEKLLKLEFPEFRLVGRVDRVDEHPDGTLEIVDYKSGRQAVCEEDVLGDLAMTTYQLLLRKMFPDRPVRATILALRSGASASCSMAADELDEFERDIYQLGLEVLAEDFDQRLPVWKPLCTRCDFFPLCRRHPDFEVPDGESVTA